jgi:phosphoglycolate phosphatase-like HAD superfamily hydrolase
VIFDVDGTLTESGDVDTEINVRAMAELFGVGDVDTDWSHYRHATDGGVFEECFARRWGRPAGPDERTRFEERVGADMEEALRAHPHRSRAVTGAPALLAALAARPEVTVALASGAYQRSMLAKLRGAGLELEALPRATGSDAIAREEIVALACARAATRAGGRRFDRVVSVGDGVWDAATARRLELAFIGVGSGAARARLEHAGARTVVDDYRDLAAFLALLAAASVERSYL